MKVVLDVPNPARLVAFGLGVLIIIIAVIVCIIVGLVKIISAIYKKKKRNANNIDEKAEVTEEINSDKTEERK